MQSPVNLSHAFVRNVTDKRFLYRYNLVLRFKFRETHSQTMSDQKTITTMRLVGGSPALDFVNTVEMRSDRWGPDLLRTYEDLIEWAVRIELITGEIGANLAKAAVSKQSAAENALVAAQDPREAIYSVFQAEARGRSAPMAQGRVLSDAVSGALTNRRLSQAGEHFVWMWKEDGFSTIADRVALEAAELLVTRAQRRPVRECLGPYCGWLFIDTSRGGHRRWCADATCGTQMRVKRFRSTQAKSA
ncbi:CGNR zinc finger domain-containing protein [Mesorhizobium loti]|uniref:CGNR zinc finger domain-containing protein n=1 Tax=Rhizobium loti TaxID=381 RepID=UPI001268B2C4|nr:CGNR zinc finger domain-containing protein [Mesorhizobium loti]